MMKDLKPIMDELKVIRNDLEYIKGAIPDKDMFLSVEESILLNESFKSEKEGRLISSKELRRKSAI